MNQPATIAPDEDVAMAPQDALRQLVESSGYQLFIEHVRSQYGNAAVLRRIKEDLIAHPAADHSALTQANIQIAEDIIKLFKWPEEEYLRLRDAARAPQAQAERFPQHRRTP